MFTACVATKTETSNYVKPADINLGLLGKNISDVESDLNLRYLKGSELFSLVNGKTLIGDSIHMIKYEDYFIQEMHSDKTGLVKIIHKKNNQLYKKIDGWKWFINDNDQLCSQGKELRWRKIADIGENYISIEDGKICRHMDCFGIKTKGCSGKK